VWIDGLWGTTPENLVGSVPVYTIDSVSLNKRMYVGCQLQKTARDFQSPIISSKSW